MICSVIAQKCRVAAGVEAARPGDVDSDDLLDAARPWRHHDDPVGEQHGLVDAVRHEQHGLGRFEPQFLKIDAHLFAGQGIERAEWLVHQQQRWTVHQRAGDGGTLAHAA